MGYMALHAPATRKQEFKPISRRDRREGQGGAPDGGPTTSPRHAARALVHDDSSRRSRLLWEEHCKRWFDVGAATLGLLLLSVLIAAVAAAIILRDGRPAIIRHRRLGRNGSPFDCLKFRTMVKNADEVLRDHLAEDPLAREEWENTRKLKHDPRITPLGQVLRKTSVDELPQLLNVLRGEMSIVGPRPIVKEEVPRYRQSIHYYYATRPGLTGLWQISGRNDVTYDERVELDRVYVCQRTFSMDLLIILKTIPAVIKSRGVY